MDLFTTMTNLGSLGVTCRLASSLGLASDLASLDCTVFAPTDDAWHTLVARTSLVDLAAAPEELLIDLLEHHVVRGRWCADDVAVLTTVQGDHVRLGRGRFGSARLVLRDVRCDNGVLQIVDAVGSPAYAAGASCTPVEHVEAYLRALGRSRSPRRLEAVAAAGWLSVPPLAKLALN